MQTDVGRLIRPIELGDPENSVSRQNFVPVYIPAR